MTASPPGGSTGPVPDDAESLLGLAVRLARIGGEVARAGRAEMSSTARGVADTKSTSTDLVTRYDRAAERAVVDELARCRPRDAVVGEEGADVTGSSGYAWYVDPIDGTTNFVYDLPSWSTSVGVADHEGMLAGAVFVPTSGELFAARRGAGATLDGRPIRCSDRDDLPLALVATGFGYAAEVRVAQARRVARLIGEVRDIRRLGSAAIDLCHAAAGRVDVYFEEHLNSWDAAAGELIAREAGCTSTDFSGGPARPGELVVAAPGVHAAFVDLLARTGDERDAR